MTRDAIKPNRFWRERRIGKSDALCCAAGR